MLSHILAHGEAPAVHVEIADLDLPTSAIEFTAPVNISEGQGLRGAEIRLSYDTTFLSADQSSVQPGSIWPSHDTMVFANVDDANGTIVAWLFRTEELDAGGGSLLDVVFRTTEAVDSDGPTSLDLTSVRLNEDRISVAPTPQPGVDETDGLVRFYYQPSLDGTQVALLDNDASSTPLESFVAPPGLAPKENSVEAGWSRSILRIEAEPEAERFVPAQPSKPNVSVPLPSAPQTVHQNAQPIQQVELGQKSVTFQPGRHATYVFPSEHTFAYATATAYESVRSNASPGDGLAAERNSTPSGDVIPSNHFACIPQIPRLRQIIRPLPADTPGPLLPIDALDYVLKHTGSWLLGTP